MNNFKSGSGNLDFGGSNEDAESTESETATSQTRSQSKTDSASSNQSTSKIESDSASSTPERDSSEETDVSDAPATEYPYFIRRSNVGDERDTRLEIHVRDKVADREGEFRNEVAEHLGASEVSKTDAREFALLVAFRNPERVAELMEDEGFGALG